VSPNNGCFHTGDKYPRRRLPTQQQEPPAGIFIASMKAQAEATAGPLEFDQINRHKQASNEVPYV
jgi:hypothetical protein